MYPGGMKLNPFVEKLAYSFGRAFLATFAVGITGLLAAPDWSTKKAALVALTVAAVTAGVRAVQHVLVDQKSTPTP